MHRFIISACMNMLCQFSLNKNNDERGKIRMEVGVEVCREKSCWFATMIKLV